MWRYHEREAGSYCDRLNRFLSDPYLRFNPYRLDDEALVAAAMRQKWGDEFSLTKMLVIEFLEVAEIPGGGVPREIVRYRIGNYSDVIEERMAEFTCRSPARDSMRQIRHTINGRSVTQSDQIHALAGKKSVCEPGCRHPHPVGDIQPCAVHAQTERTRQYPGRGDYPQDHDGC